MMKLLSLSMFLAICISCKYSPPSYSKEESEVEIFLNKYKQLLQNAKFDSVALLYVDTGFISIGNGDIAIQNLDSIKAFYSRFPKIQNDFRWENTRIDILSPETALVNSLFYWHDKDSPDTTKSSYTGVFFKINNGWKIKNEHESIDFATLTKIIMKSEQKQ